MEDFSALIEVKKRVLIGLLGCEIRRPRSLRLNGFKHGSGCSLTATEMVVSAFKKGKS